MVVHKIFWFVLRFSGFNWFLRRYKTKHFFWRIFLFAEDLISLGYCGQYLPSVVPQFNLLVLLSNYWRCLSMTFLISNTNLTLRGRQYYMNQTFFSLVNLCRWLTILKIWNFCLMKNRPHHWWYCFWHVARNFRFCKYTFYYYVLARFFKILTFQIWEKCHKFEPKGAFNE